MQSRFVMEQEAPQSTGVQREEQSRRWNSARTCKLPALPSVIDFTSSLYLGMEHSSDNLKPWRSLTTGAPAVLGEPPETAALARQFALLQGCDAAVLATSTLHVSWDLFGILAQNPIEIFLDSKTYPISRWGVQRAMTLGAAVHRFAHNDPASLARKLATPAPGHLPVIVADGLCAKCGSAPLKDYLALTKACGGLLVIDDTQALGLLGRNRTRQMPYGEGGGGSVPWSGAGGSEIIVFGSLAKAYGVPMAVLAGSRHWIRRFTERSATRMYCSPPSVANLRAAEHALDCNRRDGDARRSRLLELVRYFRRRAQAAGLSLASKTLLPIQAIAGAPEANAFELHQRMRARQVNTILNRGEHGRPQVTMLITSRHQREEIDFAINSMTRRTTRPRTAFSNNIVEHRNEQLLER